MEEDDKSKKLGKFFQEWGLWLFLGVSDLIAWIIHRKFNPFYSDKISKSDLAKEYGVSVEVMMNWSKLFFPEDIKRLYVGEKVKKVKIGYFHKYLGKPEERPKSMTDEYILTKEDLNNAFFKDRSVIRRNIQKIENHQETIKMSYEDYKQMRFLPPKHARLVVDYLSERFQISLK